MRENKRFFISVICLWLLGGSAGSLQHVETNIPTRSASYIFTGSKQTESRPVRAMDPAHDSIIADCSPADLAEMLKKHWSLENRKELCKHLIDGLGKSIVKPSSADKSTSSGSGTNNRQKQKDAVITEVAAPFHG